jgi:hypothetical protein
MTNVFLETDAIQQVQILSTVRPYFVELVESEDRLIEALDFFQATENGQNDGLGYLIARTEMIECLQCELNRLLGRTQY